MSRLQTFPLPDVGEGLTEAEILEWKVAEGDLIAINQVLVEIETAKAAVELPSPHAGRVHKILAVPGVTIEVGTPIIEIDTDPDAGPLDTPDIYDAPTGAIPEPAAGEPDTKPGEPGAGAKIGEAMADGRVQTLVGIITPQTGSRRRARHGSTEITPTPTPAPATTAATTAGAAPAATAAATAGAAAGAGAGLVGELRAPLAAPPVRKLAKDLGVDLRGVTASRPDGVICRADVEAAHAGDDTTQAKTPSPLTAAARPGRGHEAAPYDPASRERREPIKGVRKMMAAAMVESAFTAPHVTEFLSVDVTPMMKLRDRLRDRPEFAGVKLSPLAFAARAVCLAAARTPEVNCTWDETAGEVIFKQYVHLGIAAATSRGLIVPVIRDADQLDLHGLATALTDLTNTARAGRTPPADMTGGTITITNIGVLGVDTGTPIINPGQSAILALGSIKDTPWAVNGKLKIRKICQLALSFDHRIIDGQKGSQFLANIGTLLTDPAQAITY